METYMEKLMMQNVIIGPKEPIDFFYSNQKIHRKPDLRKRRELLTFEVMSKQIADF